MDTETQTALRETYLYAFDGHGAIPTDLELAEIANNARHGRELLAVLTNANLLIQEDVNGDGDVWVPAEDRDHVTREDAEGTIDNWLIQFSDQDTPSATTTPTPKKKASKVTTTTEFKKCLCGCDENVPPKSTFRPGHDARLAGQIARDMLAAGEYDDEKVAILPTEALRDKATAIFDKRIEKARAKAAKAEASATPTEAVVKAEPVTKPAPPAKKSATPRKRTAKKATAKA